MDFRKEFIVEYIYSEIQIFTILYIDCALAFTTASDCPQARRRKRQMEHEREKRNKRYLKHFQKIFIPSSFHIRSQI